MDDLTTQVVEAVKGGARTNAAIQEAIRGTVARNGYDPRIDRSIQKAKKAGAIVYRDRQWFAAGDPVDCPHCGGTGKVRPDPLQRSERQS
jgi:hypothetical protein